MFFDTILPLLLFPTISALAGILILPNVAEVEPFFRTQCPPGSKHYIPLTRNPAVDETLCVLISVFHTGLETKEVMSPFVSYFLATVVPPVMLFISIESSRKGRRFVVSYTSLISGVFAQVVSFAVSMPIFWLYFILSARFVKGRVTQIHAEASVLGMLIGWVIPSIFLVTHVDPVITVAWNFAPITSFISQLLPMLLRAPATKSGFRTVQVAYVVCFLVAASVHIKMAMDEFSTLSSMQTFFVPTLREKEIPRAMLNVFQWDFALGVGACMLGSLWFARNAAEVATIALWYPVASVFVGPGAAFTAVALCRESFLEDALAKGKVKAS